MWPQLTDLGSGNYRVLWLGQLAHDPDGVLRVEVAFLPEKCGRNGPPRWKSLKRPLEELPLYGAQARWSNGRWHGYSDVAYPRQSLTVNPDPIQAYATTALGDSRRVFTEDEYPLFEKRFTAGCAVYSTLEGIDLVVPSWQILQAFYLFDRHICAAVIAGMLDVEQDYGPYAPWLPGTSCDNSSVVYRAPRHIQPGIAKRFSRLLFDPLAQSRAMEINKRLMADKKYLPLVKPPHAGPARWTFRGWPLAPRAGRGRMLVLSLEGAAMLPPFGAFTFVQRTPPESDLAELPPSVSPATHQEPGLDDAVPLVGDRIGVRGAREHSFKGPAFIDEYLDAMSVSTSTEPSDAHPAQGVSLVLPATELPVEAVSMATQGLEDKHVLAIRPAGPSKPAEDPAVLFTRTQQAFHAVCEHVAMHPHPTSTWSARVLTDNASDCFHRFWPSPRSFAILELRIGNAFTYVVDAMRHEEDEFPLAMVRHRTYGSLGLDQFHVWLKRFPASSSRPWYEAGNFPAWLTVPLTIRHQSTELPEHIKSLAPYEQAHAAEAHHLRLFRDRLITHVSQFEMRKQRADVRRTKKRL